MTESDPRDDLLKTYLSDRSEEKVRSVASYQEQFPDVTEQVIRDVLSGSGDAPDQDIRKETGSLDQVGPYRIIRELGRGGQGIVFLAEDSRLGRKVALKVLTSWSQASPQVLARFQREAAIASKLDHSGICTVYETGEAHGAPYLAMRYVEGESLSSRIASAAAVEQTGVTSFVSLESMVGDESPEETTDDGVSATTTNSQATQASVRRVVELIEKTALAVHAAHEAGVIHRDIKPGNIMITNGGDPVILDFGLARDTEGDDHSLTQTGSLFGTPSYMAPEQLMAQRMQVDKRADVWALGVTLYECLGLRRPFDAPSRDGLYQAILHRDPPELRRLNTAVSKDLAVVIQMAMEKERDRRYQTALDFAEDLRRFIDRVPIKAKPVGPVTRTVRWAQRNTAVAALASLLFVSMSVGLIWISLQNEKLQSKTVEAQANAASLAESNEELTKKTKEAERLSYSAFLHAAQAAFKVGNLRESRRLHNLCPENQRNWEWRHLGLKLDQSLRVMKGHLKMLTSVAWSPDGGRIVSGSWDRTLRIWDVDTGECLQTLKGHESNVNCLAWSPDGTRILSGCVDRTLRIWDAENGDSLHTFEGHAATVNSVAWSPDGTRVVSGSHDESLRIWDAVTGDSLHTLKSKGWVLTVDWSPDGRRIVSGSADTRVRIWDAARGELLQIFNGGHGASVYCAAWSPDGRQIVTGSIDEKLCIWDAVSGEIVRTQAGGGGWVISVNWSPDGTRIAWTADDQTLRITDVATGEHVQTLVGHKFAVNSSSWSPDGTMIVSGSVDKTLRIWDTASGHSQQGFEEQVPVPATCVAWSPDGGRFVSGHQDKTVHLWDATTGEDLQALQGHTSPVRALAWSPEGSRFASVSDDGSMRIWDASSGENLQIISMEGDGVGLFLCLSWSPDGSRIVVGVGDETLRVWDAATGKSLQTLKGHEKWTMAVAWSPDGTRILSGSLDRTLRIWDGETGENLQIITGPSPTSVTWSPDSTRVVSGSSDGILRIWDADSGVLLGILRGHTKGVGSISWSPDGTRLLSGSADKTLRIWDAVDGQSLAILEGSRSAWSPDGSRILAIKPKPSPLHTLGSIQILESRLEDMRPLWRAGEWRRRVPVKDK